MAEFYNHYQESNPDPKPPANSAGQDRLNPGGAIRFTNGAHGEGEQFGGVARYTVGSEAPAAGSSIMATARRDSNGLSVETRPGDPTSRTLVQSAVRDGLVRETGPGMYADNIEAIKGADAAPEGNPQANDQGNPADPGFGVFDPAEDAIWNKGIEPLEQAHFDASIARGISAALTDGDLGSVALELAKSAGIDPAHAEEYVGAGHEMHQRIADRELGKLGLFDDDLQAAYAWMRESKGTALRHCLQEFVMGRNIAPLRKLAGEYQAEKLRRG